MEDIFMYYKVQSVSHTHTMHCCSWSDLFVKDWISTMKLANIKELANISVHGIDEYLLTGH